MNRKEIDSELERLEQGCILGITEKAKKDVEAKEEEKAKQGAETARKEKKGVDGTPGSDDRSRIDVLCGLALSGGGIRSATFNLGVLQALAEKGILGGFHYLSTVSGGGYIGGFWSAWRRRCVERKKGEEEKDEIFPPAGSRHVRHLRNFSNFLRPRLSLISFETGRMVTAFLVGIVPTLLATCGVLMGALLAWLFIAWLLMELSAGAAALSWGIALLTALIFFQVAWYRWSTEEKVRGEGVVFYFLLLMILFVSAFLWEALWHLVPLPLELRVAPVALEDVRAVHWIAAILPSVGLLLPVVALIVFRGFVTKCPGRARSAEDRFRLRRVILTSLESVIDRMLFLGLVWLGIGVLWVGGQVVAGSGVSGIVGALSVSGTGGGVFVWLRRFLRTQPNKPGGGRIQAALGTSSIQLVAYLTLTATVLLVAALVSGVLGAYGRVGFMALAAITVGLLVYPFFFDPREMAFHSFYRQRLARAYLGAASHESCEGTDGGKARATLECSTDDIALDDLAPGRPFHLICCAANDLAGDHIASLHRGAESAVLSAIGIQVGERWARWKANDEPTSKKAGVRPVAPSLSSAMTASAAAFNSHMGSKSMKLGQAATFLLTALNLRLGLWIDNPAKERTGLFHHLPPFFRELFGFSDRWAPQVHLSDGAHFENLALYELVRRRCRFILVSDCGEDPDYAFDDLANAIRRIRTDFGAEIQIDPTPLRPSPESRRSRQAVVAGTIRYPPRNPGKSSEGEKKGKDEHGVVILVKPTLVGDEPADVLQYADRNPSFPQESTSDQFYDEEQWESYRRLGKHAVEEALNQVAEESSMRPDLFLEVDDCIDVKELRWFLAQGSLQWAPDFEVDPEKAVEMEERWARLEDGLARDEKAEELKIRVLGPDKPRRSVEELDGVSIDSARHIRSMLQLMESVLRTHDLDREQIHPDPYAWVNRFGRWIRTPEFVCLWLFLSPTLSRRLKRFLENAYGDHLPKLRSWKKVRGRVQNSSRDGKDGKWPCFYELHVEIGEAGAAGWRVKQKIEVGSVKVSKEGEKIFWKSDDFQIYPGFGGCGFADKCLRALCDKLLQEHGVVKKEESAGAERKCLELRVEYEDLGPVGVALYGGVGFHFLEGGEALMTVVGSVEGDGDVSNKAEDDGSDTSSKGPANINTI